MSERTGARKGIFGIDDQAFIIAIILIGAYVIFYGTVLYLDRTYTGVEKVSATFGSAVTGVIGFYFGQRPVQAATQQAQSAISDRDKYRRGYAETLDTDIVKTEKIQQYEDQIKSLKNQLESLKSQLNIE